jgi:hypothetical protein
VGPGLPEGIGLDRSTGLLSGVPAAAGAYSFDVRITDLATNQVRFQRVSQWRIYNRLAIGGGDRLPRATAARAYSQQMTATGRSQGELRWRFGRLLLGASDTVPTADVPNRLSISQSGLISGTPANSGEFRFWIEVTDAQGTALGQKEVFLDVAPDPNGRFTISKNALRFYFPKGVLRSEIQTVFVGGTDPRQFTAAARYPQGEFRSRLADRGYARTTIAPREGYAGRDVGIQIEFGQEPGSGPQRNTFDIDFYEQFASTPFHTVRIEVSAEPQPRLISQRRISFDYDPESPDSGALTAPLAVESGGDDAQSYLASVELLTGGSAAPGWLAIDRASGMTPDFLTVRVVDPRRLPPGRYGGVIRFSRGAPAQLTVEGRAAAAQAAEVEACTFVDLAIGADTPLVASPREVALEPPSIASQDVRVIPLASSGNRFFVKIDSCAQAWVRLPETVKPESPLPALQRMAVSADTRGLNPGTYQGMIAFEAAAGTGADVIDVTLRLPDTADPAAVVDRDLVAFDAAQNGAPPDSQIVSVGSGAAPPPPRGASATGPAANVSVSWGSESNWLAVAPPNEMRSPGQLTLGASAAGLGVGLYRGRVALSPLGKAAPSSAVRTLLRVSPPAALKATAAIPQIASGRVWYTTITLVNLNPRPALARVSFYRSDGSAWPLEFEGRAGGSAIEETIPGNGSRTLRTAYSSSSADAFAVETGWAQVESTSALSGFAIFRQRIKGVPDVADRPDFEAVAPMVQATRSSFIMPFDNSGEYGTSVAIVNPDTEKATIVAQARMGDGATAAEARFEIEARGQAAFELGRLLAVSAGRRGTVEFTTDRGTIAGLGLRFNQTGAFTSLPVLTRGAGAQGGARRIMAQIAEGITLLNGEPVGETWDTTFILTNTSALPAVAQVSFTGTDGSPLDLDLRGLSSLEPPPPASSVRETVKGHDSVFISTGGLRRGLLTGWAEIASSGATSGTAIFRQKFAGRPFDFEAAVPTSLDAASSFYLPFDNTAPEPGLSFVTSMAIVNAAAESTVVRAAFHGEDGSVIERGELELPARGQRSFEIPLRFPATSGHRGVAEFSTLGTPITGIGLRFVSGASFTSIPVVLK